MTNASARNVLSNRTSTTTKTIVSTTSRTLSLVSVVFGASAFFDPGAGRVAALGLSTISGLPSRRPSAPGRTTGVPGAMASDGRGGESPGLIEPGGTGLVSSGIYHVGLLVKPSYSPRIGQLALPCPARALPAKRMARQMHQEGGAEHLGLGDRGHGP